MKFKVGDKVKVVGNDNGSGSFIGNTLIITQVVPGHTGGSGKEYPYKLGDVSGWWCEGELEKLNNNEMNKVSAMMKRLLDADTQALVKAGFINGDLDLTQEGKVAMWGILFDANKPALVAAAQALIAEAKEDK